MSSICSRMQKDFCNLLDNKKVSSKITFCPVIGSHRRRRHSFSYKIRAEIKAIRQLPTKGPVSSSCKIVTVALSFNNIQSAIKILIFHLYRTHLYSFQFKFCHRHHHESKEVLTVSDYILQFFFWSVEQYAQECRKTSAICMTTNKSPKNHLLPRDWLPLPSALLFKIRASSLIFSAKSKAKNWSKTVIFQSHFLIFIKENVCGFV